MRSFVTGLPLLSRSITVRKYTVALARNISPDIENGISIDNPSNNEGIANYDIANDQHQTYLETMRSIIPTLSLPFLPEHPDGCFVEDTLVTLGRTAVMTNPGHDSRCGEVKSMGDIVQQLGMRVVDMKQEDPKATLDGGDVLNTGRHMYVGLSNRTNSEGFRVLEKAFGEYTKVIPVQLSSSSVLHLKSVVTHLDDETLLVPVGQEEILTNMLDSGGYECIKFPDKRLANVVVVNGHVLAQETACEESKNILEVACQERSLRLHWLDMSELAKVDGALTCCSVLLDI